MSKKQILTRSIIPLTPDGEAKICLSDLGARQKEHIGSKLQIEFLNALYAGRVHFFVEDKLPYSDIFSNILQAE